MSAIFPASTLAYLPFAAEAISVWDVNTDLAQFIRVLYADHVVMSILSEDGTEHLMDPLFFTQFANFLYDSAIKEACEWAEEFENTAYDINRNKSIEENVAEIPNFSKDVIFGRAIKYIIAWDRVIQAITE